jgi:hypothetical protein
MQLASKELVVLAVNDNPDVEAAAGGSHWCAAAAHYVCVYARGGPRGGGEDRAGITEGGS